MAEQRASGGSGTEPIALDVLIIGGGIMGLWLLNELGQAHYSVVLLERGALGGGQTCHSHVYLHRGHLYREVALASRLQGVQALWDRWFQNHVPPPFGLPPSYFGFRNLADAQQVAQSWDHPALTLTYQSTSVPAALQAGGLKVVLESPEICLEGEWLVHELSQSVQPFISQIEETRDILVNSTTRTVEEVRVTMPQGRSLTFRPKALVLAAGEGNQTLLDLLSRGHEPLRQRVRDAQQIRRSHMLVVKDVQGNVLEPLVGIFPSFLGLFIVSRISNGATVWLISDYRGPRLSSDEDRAKYTAQWWLPEVVAALRELAPPYFQQQPDRLQWGIYEAPKAEGGVERNVPYHGLPHQGLPHEERIEQFGLQNVWTVWPTKLTLAPQASAEVLRHLQQLIPLGSPWHSIPAAWTERRVLPSVAQERWKETPLMSWDNFCRCYNLPYIA